jgi:hypothetical protein
MARSFRKSPIVPVSVAPTDKPFKVSEHRRLRRAVKVALLVGDDPPAEKAFGNPWNGRKDGKRYLAEPSPSAMRK